MTRAQRIRSLIPILAASVGQSGCSSSEGDAPSEFTLLATCQTIDSRWNAATPTGTDGFQVLRTIGGALGDGGADRAVVKSVGTLCGGATDHAACATKVRDASGNGGWDPYGGVAGGPRSATPEIAIATTGDTVTRIDTVEALAALLAPIESVDEAMLIAGLRGYDAPECSGSARVARQVGDAFVLYLQRGGYCSDGTRGAVRVERDGTFSVASEEIVKKTGAACGRRPMSLVSVDAHEDDGSAGAFLARMAYLEAASIPAFAELARDLSRHGAPRSLLTRLDLSRRDEIRHARLTRMAARRLGVEPSKARARRSSERALFEIALSNAVEGCVRETYGAAVAAHQALRVPDASLAALFDSIARDETEHAALSWDLAEWLESRLSEEERARVVDAREKAFLDLARELRVEASEGERALGVPSRETALAILATLRAESLRGDA